MSNLKWEKIEGLIENLQEYHKWENLTNDEKHMVNQYAFYKEYYDLFNELEEIGEYTLVRIGLRDEAERLKNFIIKIYDEYKEGKSIFN